MLSVTDSPAATAEALEPVARFVGAPEFVSLNSANPGLVLMELRQTLALTPGAAADLVAEMHAAGQSARPALDRVNLALDGNPDVAAAVKKADTLQARAVTAKTEAEIAAERHRLAADVWRDRLADGDPSPTDDAELDGLALAAARLKAKAAELERLAAEARKAVEPAKQAVKAAAALEVAAEYETRFIDAAGDLAERLVAAAPKLTAAATGATAVAYYYPRKGKR